MESLDYVKTNAPEKYEALKEKIKFYEHTETNRWKEIVKNIYLPHDQELDVFVQHDGFLDKELLTIDDLKEADKPINQNWSWDRILRSVYIKQADVLQGIYFFEDHFDEGIIRRNFDFYEPRTVHESSLSPCVHAVLAAKLGKEEKAYEMYLRTARLDLDDYNNDTEDGCHITSMAGTWMAVVQGFGGMRVRDGKLILNPFAPSQWKSYSFKIRFRGALLKVKVDQEMVEVCNESDQESQLLIWNKVVDLAPHSVIRESLK
jgi:maltose phosphorylase